MIKRVCVVESTFTNGKIYHEGDIVEFDPTVKINDNWWLDEKYFKQGFEGSNADYKKQFEKEEPKKEEPKKESK